MFYVTQKLSTAKNYSGLDISVDHSEESLQVGYTVVGISELTSGSGTGEYVATINNSSSSPKLFLFDYSGAGNPFTEAEEYLKTIITT